MTFTQFDKLTEEILDKVLQIKDTKGKEYTGTDTDRLKNFKDIAEECGLSPIQVWHCYYKKHIRAIDSYVRTGQVFSEPIEGRFIDAITYLLLGWGLIVESLEICDVCKESTCICPSETYKEEVRRVRREILLCASQSEIKISPLTILL